MAPSARSKLALAIVAIPLVGLCGCVTTQEKNARTVLLNERTLATETAVHVTRENPAVQVAGITLIRTGAGQALAVRIVNTSERPLTDLPVSVGVRTATGRRLYLNASPNIEYYDAHVSALSPGAQITWVFADRRLPRGAGRPFAVVGLSSLRASAPHVLPRINVAAQTVLAHGLRVSVSNPSGVPQSGLQVYAVAVKAGQAVGVARGTVSQLDGGARTTISLRLVGSATGAAIHVYALPTIFA